MSVLLDEIEVQLTTTQIDDDRYLAELRERAIQANTCRINASTILSLPSTIRQNLVAFAADLVGNHLSISFCLRDGQFSTDFFQAVLDLLRDCSVNDISTATELAIEVVALTSNGTGIRIECNRIVECLRGRNVRGVRANQLARQALAFLEQRNRGSQQVDQDRIHLRWPDAPGPYGMRVPAGWVVGDTEIVSCDGKDLILCRLLITQVFQDVEGHHFSLELAWKRGSRWLRHVCTRSEISCRTAIVQLANVGLPVTTNNATSFIQYLADFEQENLNALPCSQIASRMGWFERDGQYVFLCGRTPIWRHNDSPDDEPQQLTFLGDDDGDEQIAAGIRADGDFHRWLEVVGTIQQCPRAMLTLYAALAAPILRVVGAPNFVLSLDGRTSIGKTTAQMLAASCWGYPVINGGDSSPAIRCWDTTPVYIERTAALSNGIPTIVDDTKVARRPDDITNTVYQIANGGGRGRGSQRGIAMTRNIQTVLISSGEDPITSYSRAGGSRARVLGLWGGPFAELPNAAQAVVHLRDVISDHYGHAGPTLVQHLVDKQRLWGEWRERYREARRRYEQRAQGNAVAGRMAACFAVLELTAQLAHEAIGLPFEYLDTVSVLWDEITADTDEADQGLAAMRFFIAWARSKEHCFLGGHRAPSDPPSSGWLGRWRCVGRSDDTQCLTIYPHILDDVLNQHGFPAESIRRHWLENGWLRTEGRKTTLRVSMDGRKSPMVAILWDTIEQLMEGSERMDRSSGEAQSGNSERTWISA